MSKLSSLTIIDEELGVDPHVGGSSEYEALKIAMTNWFDKRDLEQFAEFLQDENN